MSLAALLKALVRRQTPILLGDLRRVKPISREFGFERGLPIDRYYIETFLRENQALIRGDVLEVGGDDYTRQFGGDRVETATVLGPVAGKKITLVGDLADPANLPEQRFDCFICTQTLNFVFDVQAAVEGAERLLKPDGILLGTVAGLCQISRFDMARWGDYWRFTTRSIERLMDPVFGDKLRISCYGNVLAACAFLQGAVVEDLPEAALLDRHDTDYQMIIAFVARRNR